MRCADRVVTPATTLSLRNATLNERGGNLGFYFEIESDEDFSPFPWNW